MFVCFVSVTCIRAQVNPAVSDYAEEYAKFFENGKNLSDYLSVETKSLMDKESLTAKEKEKLKLLLEDDIKGLYANSPSLRSAAERLQATGISSDDLRGQFDQLQSGDMGFSWPCIPNEAACRRSRWIVNNSWWLGSGAMAIGLAGVHTHCRDC